MVVIIGFYYGSVTKNVLDCSNNHCSYNDCSDNPGHSW